MSENIKSGAERAMTNEELLDDLGVKEASIDRCVGQQETDECRKRIEALRAEILKRMAGGSRSGLDAGALSQLKKEQP